MDPISQPVGGRRTWRWRLRGVRLVVLVFLPATVFSGLVTLGLAVESVAQGWLQPLIIPVAWHWAFLVAASVWWWRHPMPPHRPAGWHLFLWWVLVGRGLVGMVGTVALTVVVTTVLSS